MAARVFVSLTDGRASSLARGGGGKKSWAWHFFPSPNPLFPLPILPSLHQSFIAHPVFFLPFLFFTPLPPAGLRLLCRRFDIGNAVSALHGNNSGKDDINYLPIVWHMQGIVLAIIISTLSPEGINGATAALLLCAKLLGLFREVVGGIGILLLLLLVRDTQCACPRSLGQGWITINPLNPKTSSAFSICICAKEEGQRSKNSSEYNPIHFTQSDYVLL